MNRRFYFMTSPFALGKVLMALLDDDNVDEVCVSLEDNELLVSFSRNTPKDKNIEPEGKYCSIPESRQYKAPLSVG